MIVLGDLQSETTQKKLTNNSWGYCIEVSVDGTYLAVVERDRWRKMAR